MGIDGVCLCIGPAAWQRSPIPREEEHDHEQ